MAEITIHSNNIENIRIGRLQAKWSARGDRILRYYIDLRHLKLNIHRELSAPELSILQSKVDALTADWDQRYTSFQARQQIRSAQQSAEALSVAAAEQLTSLQRILSHTLSVNDAVNWEALKDYSEYPMPKSFGRPPPRSHPSPAPVYQAPKLSMWTVLTGKREKVLAEALRTHQLAVAAWEEGEKAQEKTHERDLAAWEAERAAFWAHHSKAKETFQQQQAASNAKVDELRTSLEAGDPEAVVEHASLILEASDYAGLFEKGYEVQYEPADRTLLISYALPTPSTLPNVKSVRLVKATGELLEARISEREQKANFESVCYQICLRTIHEVLEADSSQNIERVLFNGHVTAVDPRTGREVRSCIMSLLATRADFGEIDLSRVDPKACFKSLKGVSGASLAALNPIAPIIDLDTDDRRFVEGREIGSTFDDGTNLATISWEDFEHLVREVFEQEFLLRGGEVKVTRSSRDGGVDAIAFDPDPISGGKIVIQAKRYTRTVGVGAVRDLYGTVLNEGASKGILVTTADYGPDAFKFAAGKPITLMSGANLLHLMQKHGHRAHIDVRAARAAMA